MNWTDTLKDIYDRSTKAQRWLVLLSIPVVIIIFLAFNNLDSIFDGIGNIRREHYEIEKRDAIDSVRRQMWHRMRMLRHEKDSLQNIIDSLQHSKADTL